MDGASSRLFAEVSMAVLGIACGGAGVVCARDGRRRLIVVVVVVISFEEDDGKVARTNWDPVARPQLFVKVSTDGSCIRRR